MTRYRATVYLAGVPTAEAAARAAGLRTSGTVTVCDFPEGAVLPPDVPQETLDRLLGSGQIEPVAE